MTKKATDPMLAEFARLHQALDDEMFEVAEAVGALAQSVAVLAKKIDVLRAEVDAGFRRLDRGGLSS